MNYLAIIAMCAATTASAQGHFSEEPWSPTHDPETWYHHAEDDKDYFGVVMHHNQRTFGTPNEEFFTLETPHGDVVVHLNRVPENCEEASCPDTLSIWDLPAGVIARPMSVTTEERLLNPIFLYLYEGS